MMDQPATTAGRFQRAGEGTKELVDAFNDWSSILTNRSIELALAVIAANWAAHGAARQIMANGWAKSSVVVAIFFLSFNLIATWGMIGFHWSRIRHAEADHGRWEAEFAETAGTNDPWPYTAGIERLGTAMRLAKLLLPTLAAGLFVISLF